MQNFSDVFPFFPPNGLPEIPHGWFDVSEGETCPTFQSPNGEMTLIIEHPDRSKRTGDVKRFTLLRYEATRQITVSNEAWEPISAAIEREPALPMVPLTIMATMAGLTPDDVATLTKEDIDHVMIWWMGAEATPAAVLETVATVFNALTDIARQLADQISNHAESEHGLEKADLKYPMSDTEAQQQGFVTRGAWQAMAAHVLAAHPTQITLTPARSINLVVSNDRKD
jgi:hypothetical protein